MKFISLLLSLLLTSPAFSQETTQDIVIGKFHTIHSKILGEDKDIWLYVPPHGRSIDFEAPKFPVVYLLDGEDHFESMLASLKKRCNSDLDAFCPQMILVGVTHNDRGRELSPTKSAGLMPPHTVNENGGGGEEFTAYLEKELIPYIDANYPTSPYRTLIGHSLGGLLVMNTMMHHNHLFNAYVSIDPSMWWDNERLLKQIQTGLKTGNFDKSKLYLAIANSMPAGMSLTQAKRDKSLDTKVIRSILSLSKSLASNTKMHAKSKFYVRENHGSVTFLAQDDALRFVFDFYRLPNDLAYFKEEFDGIPSLQAHFKKVSLTLGYQVLPPGDLLNGLGRRFLARGAFAKAFYYFDFNLKNYPNSPHAMDSMGDYYLAIGNKIRAIELFKQAISLGAHPIVQKKLDQLLIEN